MSIVDTNVNSTSLTVPVAADEVVLRAHDLWRTYHRGTEEIHALAGLDLVLHAGEMISVVGRSGSGKTTFLNLVGCLDRPSRGTLEIKGTDVTRLPERDLVRFRRDHIGFIFQLFYLIPTLTVRENIEMPLIFARRHDPDRVMELIRQVGLAKHADVLPAQLDGGGMQRVAIARALVNRPRLLLADEPTGRLEHRSRDAILGLLRELQQDGLAVILATHDRSLADQTDRIMEMRDGRVIRDESQHAAAA